ncbi:TIM barrel protein [Nakamurella leprariae]|uniref:TIM barrel protein n=1 Tax=Nakamurella leprariae TaxID=2803911 RepID=A0A938YGT0_9ACTN|nr:TIM barrel protein [Nakamurella leprariae]MBM9468097.1 TIM barrel protein [Nakamurella leprariae]
MQFAANLSLLFTEYPLLERFDRAAAAGFTGVEFFFPYGLPEADLTAALTRNGLELVLFNVPMGDWDAGERGLAAQPDREAEFRAGVERAAHWASVLRPQRVNSPTGPAGPGPAARDTLLRNLTFAAERLRAVGTPLSLEPINRTDVPGAAVATVAEAVAVLDEIGDPDLGIQYDLYHSLMEGEDPGAVLAEHLPRIRHVQIADVPGRHQPGTGAVDFPAFLDRLEGGGYDGWVSLEYHPDGPTEDSFAAFGPHGPRATGR